MTDEILRRIEVCQGELTEQVKLHNIPEDRPAVEELEPIISLQNKKQCQSLPYLGGLHTYNMQQ